MVFFQVLEAVTVSTTYGLRSQFVFSGLVGTKGVDPQPLFLLVRTVFESSFQVIQGVHSCGIPGGHLITRAGGVVTRYQRMGLLLSAKWKMPLNNDLWTWTWLSRIVAARMPEPSLNRKTWNIGLLQLYMRDKYILESEREIVGWWTNSWQVLPWNDTNGQDVTPLEFQ